MFEVRNEVSMILPQRSSDVAEGERPTGESSIASFKDSPLLEAFIAGPRPDPALVRDFFARAFENPRLYLSQLAAAQCYLEGIKGADVERIKTLAKLGGLLKLRLRRPAAPDAASELDVPIQFRRGLGGNDQKAYVDS